MPGLPRVKLWDGKEAWLITRYDDFKAVLRDNRFSADTRHPNFPNASPGMQVARGNYRAFVSMDEPEHGAHRRLLTAEFSRNRILELGPKIQAIVDELLEKFLVGQSSGDFYSEVTLPLPSRVICMMLGVPYEAHQFFQQRAEVMISTESTVEEVVEASRELIDEYLGTARTPLQMLWSRLARAMRVKISAPQTTAWRGQLTSAPGRQEVWTQRRQSQRP